MASFVGYFTGADQTAPAYDPGMSALCPICLRQLERPVVTISLMLQRGARRSYFFRAHKACWDGASPAEQAEIESSIIDAPHTGDQT